MLTFRVYVYVYVREQSQRENERVHHTQVVWFNSGFIRYSLCICTHTHTKLEIFKEKWGEKNDSFPPPLTPLLELIFFFFFYNRVISFTFVHFFLILKVSWGVCFGFFCFFFLFTENKTFSSMFFFFSLSPKLILIAFLLGSHL